MEEMTLKELGELLDAQGTTLELRSDKLGFHGKLVRDTLVSEASASRLGALLELLLACGVPAR